MAENKEKMMAAEKLLESLCDEQWDSLPKQEQTYRRAEAIQFVREHTGKPIAWLLTDQGINNLQVDTVSAVISRAWAASSIDLLMRVNGKNECHEADWLKHLIRSKS